MTPVREALEAKIERLRKSHFAGMEIMRNFALEIIEALSAAPGEPCAPSLPKRPFAFAVKRTPENGEDQWRLFMDEAAARAEAEQLDGEYEGLYRVGDRRSAVESLRREAPAPAEGVKPSSIVTCCVTGAIPGDGGACGDCDPCIMGEASVPDPVKRLIAEKNSLLQRVGELGDAATARPDTAEARKGIVPLADHAAIGMMLVEKVPQSVYAAIVTITAHCAALQLDPSSDRVFDIGGCISQECMTLARALSQSSSTAEARLRAEDGGSDV